MGREPIWKLHKVSKRFYGYADGRHYLRARWNWEQVHGPIPQGFEVHHDNGDRVDDRVENLRLLSEPEHKALHDAIPVPYSCRHCGGEFAAPRAWIRTCCPDCEVERRRKWNREADAKRWSKVVTCKECGSEFATRSGTLCSQRCVNLWTHREGLRPRRR